MPSIFNASDNAGFLDRIETLRPETPAKWGKMNAAQMLSHCQAPMRVALGEAKLSRGILGLLFGRMAKKKLLADKPWGEGTPTDKSFIRTGIECDFQTEKEKLTALVRHFHAVGPAGLTAEPHPFFGKLTLEEWDVLQTRHLDHHLRQFGA